MRAVTPRELPLSRVLLGIRSLPARLAGSDGLAARADAPLLDQMLD